MSEEERAKAELDAADALLFTAARAIELAAKSYINGHYYKSLQAAVTEEIRAVMELRSLVVKARNERSVTP